MRSSSSTLKKDKYYKLPGDGIEADEGHSVAAVREAMEETGCIVKVDGEWMATTEAGSLKHLSLFMISVPAPYMAILSQNTTFLASELIGLH